MPGLDVEPGHGRDEAEVAGERLERGAERRRAADEVVGQPERPERDGGADEGREVGAGVGLERGLPQPAERPVGHDGERVLRGSVRNPDRAGEGRGVEAGGIEPAEDGVEGRCGNHAAGGKWRPMTG